MTEENAARYQSIQPPEGLREKVLALEQKAPLPRRRGQRGMWLAAACLALALVLILPQFSPNRTLSLSYEGKPLSSQPLSLPGPVPLEEGPGGRAAPAEENEIFQLPLTLKARQETRLSLTGGTLQATDLDTGALLGEGPMLTLTGNAQLWWQVTPQDSPAALILASPDRTLVATLTWEKIQESWILTTY